MLLESMVPLAPTLLDQRHRCIGTGRPAAALLKLVQRFLRHEKVDQRFRLCTGLEAERTRCSAVVAHGQTADAQRALAIFAANAECSLVHARKNQDSARLRDQFPATGHAGVQGGHRPLEAAVDLGTPFGRGRIGTLVGAASGRGQRCGGRHDRRHQSACLWNQMRRSSGSTRRSVSMAPPCGPVRPVNQIRLAHATARPESAPGCPDGRRAAGRPS